MAGVTISYKGSQIASMTSTGTKTLTTSGQYCEDNITIGYSAPSLESVTVNEQYLSSQTTTINSQTKVCETDSNYPGTILTMTNQRYCNFGDYLGSNIKIELNKTYHINGQFNIKWDDDNTEEYYTVNTDFKPTTYSTISISYTWEGSSGAIQTFPNMYLEIASQGVKTRIRPMRSGTITKTGILLSGSYYEILQNNIDGYESVTLNLLDNPQYLNIYKSLAYRSIIASSASLVSDWCNSLSIIRSQQFMGQPLSGNFVFNNVTSIQQYAFAWNYIGGFGGSTGYYTFTFPKLTSFNNYAAFGYNHGLKSIYCPSVTNISANTFYSCNDLTSISFPVCSIISSSAFCYCAELETASFPSCTKIGTYAFASCINLTAISFPVCTSIDYGAFSKCSKLETISFPSCTTIGTYAFTSCINLTAISFSVCTSIGQYAFSGCSNLTTISFPLCTTISGYAFRNCSKLSQAYFMGSSIVSIENSIFYYTPISDSTYLGYFGSIYVPSSLLNSYKTATNWTQYSNRMVGI